LRNLGFHAGVSKKRRSAKKAPPGNGSRRTRTMHATFCSRSRIMLAENTKPLICGFYQFFFHHWLQDSKVSSWNSPRRVLSFCICEKRKGNHWYSHQPPGRELSTNPVSDNQTDRGKTNRTRICTNPSAKPSHHNQNSIRTWLASQYIATNCEVPLLLVTSKEKKLDISYLLPSGFVTQQNGFRTSCISLIYYRVSWWLQ
jgi:hypothetical protein